MTAIDRTAYPRLDARLTRQELDARYMLTASDVAFVLGSARGEAGRLMLATLLKTRQDFGCFPEHDEIHPDTMAHLAAQLGLTVLAWPKEAHGTKSFYRYQAEVRARLSVAPYGDAAEELVTRTTLEGAETMSDPADLIKACAAERNRKPA